MVMELLIQGEQRLMGNNNATSSQPEELAYTPSIVPDYEPPLKRKIVVSERTKAGGGNSQDAHNGNSVVDFKVAGS
jgi:hypothetical protein